jgi:hypothetical protein
MNGDLLMQTEPDDDVAIEPEADLDIEVEPELELAIEPETGIAPATETAFAPLALVEILPADFKLPALIKFIPNPALRVAADAAATYALGIAVEGPEGLRRADLALGALRASVKAIDEHFEEPAQISNQLHKHITSTRAEWQTAGKAAVETVGRRVWAEQRRLDDLAAAQRRKDQEEADRQARETARLEAEAAEKAKAPAPVVEELQRQAKTATAPPVARSATAPPPLQNSSTVTTWKARIAGTPGSDEPNPETAELSPAQRLQVFELLKAILDGKAPLAAVEIAWPYLNKRAKADKSTLAIPGIEAFEEGGVRSKGSRSK